MLARGVALQFLRKDRHAKAASLHSLHHTELQNFHNLCNCRASPERVLNVTARAGAINVRISGVERDEQQFQFLWGKNPFRG